jgi:hypothetical protein
MVLGLVAFACGSVWAGVAGAGTAVVTSPFGGSVCMSPADVTASLHDPNGFFASAPKCEQLCAQALKNCKQFVKSAAVCENSQIDDEAAFEKAECEVEFEHGQEVKSCKSEVEDEHRGDHSTARSDRDAAFAQCQSWADTCKATCPK